MAKSNKKKNKNDTRVSCPLCKKKVNRKVRSMQEHYLKCHGVVISEGAAFRLVTTKSSKRHIFYDNVLKHPLEVQGGAPGLGKKK